MSRKNIPNYRDSFEQDLFFRVRDYESRGWRCRIEVPILLSLVRSPDEEIVETAESLREKILALRKINSSHKKTLDAFDFFTAKSELYLRAHEIQFRPHPKQGYTIRSLTNSELDQSETFGEILPLGETKKLILAFESEGYRIIPRGDKPLILLPSREILDWDLDPKNLDLLKHPNLEGASTYVSLVYPEYVKKYLPNLLI